MIPSDRPNPIRGPYDHNVAERMPVNVNRTQSRRARSIPDEMMLDLDPKEKMIEDDHDGCRIDTARLQAQLQQMEILAQNQDQRQLNMENTANGLAKSLPTALTQVEEQAVKHQELLRRHQECLGELNQRSLQFDESQKTLESTADALVTQRDRDTGAYRSEMQVLAQQALLQEQELKNQHQRGEQDAQSDLQLKSEILALQKRFNDLERSQQTASSSTTMPPPTRTLQPEVLRTPVSRTNCARCETNPNTTMIPPGTGGLLMSAPIVEGCPVFTPSTYSQWKREVRLWIAAQCGATQTQLLSKLITILPQPAMVSGLAYMETTEITPEIRSINHFLALLDERYGKRIQRNRGPG